MHYVDEGAGDPILLLHGNPAWRFLYRDVIPPVVNAGALRHRPRHYRLRSLRQAGPRISAHPGRAHREPYRSGPPARSRPPDGGPARLGWANRPGPHDEQREAGACAGCHEHIGVADATGGVPHPPAPLAHHTSSACRALSAAPLQCACAERSVLVGRRPRAVPARGAGHLRRHPARCQDQDAPVNLGLAALDSPRRHGWHPGAVYLARSGIGKVPNADAENLGARGRGVRRCDIRRTAQAPAAACRGAACGDRPPLLAESSGPEISQLIAAFLHRRRGA
jgi:hypothetical protein